MEKEKVLQILKDPGEFNRRDQEIARLTAVGIIEGYDQALRIMGMFEKQRLKKLTCSG